jgi:ABC-type Fe3+-hydroxamate transport system substrate-binding protein
VTDLEKRLIEVVSDIDRRLKNLENRVSKIPDPFVLYYKPPGEEYKKINEALDDVYCRINILEMLTDK